MKRLIMSIVAFAAVFAAKADYETQSETVGETMWYYIVTNGTAMVTGARNANDSSWTTYPLGDIVIPSSLGGSPVTAVKDYSFRYTTSISSVVIPDSVTTIGMESFCFCGNLTSLKIGSGLKTIGADSLINNENLQTLVVAEGNPNFTSQGGLLMNKAKTKVVACAGSVASVSIPSTVVEIGPSAFSRCAISSVTLPASLKTLGEQSFYYCTNLTALTIPAGVANIPYAAFSGCSALASLNLGSVKTIGEYAFSDCNSLTSVTIPNTTTTISGDAFSYCRSLETVHIGSAVTLIGTMPYDEEDEWSKWRVNFQPAFAPCGKLMNFTIEANNAVYEEIGGCLYYKASPNTAKELAVYPSGRDSLYFNLPRNVNVTKIGVGACARCDDFEAVTVPGHIKNIGEQAFVNCALLSKVKIEDGVTNIDYGAFMMNMNVMDVEIAGTVKKVGDYAFMHDYNSMSFDYDNPNPGKLVLHDGIEEIGAVAFERCFYLGEVVIPDSVKKIGESSFNDTRYASRVVIGSGVTEIPDCAFSGWGRRATELTIGKNVKTIGESAFSGFERLSKIVIPEGVTKIGGWAFSESYKASTVSMPDTLTYIGTNAFQYCSSITKQVVPLSVKTIEKGAFMGNSSLRWIYLPAALKPATADGVNEYISYISEDEIDPDSMVVWYSTKAEIAGSKVTYNLNYSGTTPTTEAVLGFIDRLPVPTFKPAGKAFYGWWTAANGGEQITNGYEVKSDVTLYAHWVDCPFDSPADMRLWYAGYYDDYEFEDYVWVSQPLAANDKAVITKTVTGPCTVRFAWKNFCEDYEFQDSLCVYVDGKKWASYGPDDSTWNYITYEIPQAGNHTFTWSYENNSGLEDSCAMIGGVTVEAAEAHTITFDPRGGTMAESTTRVTINSMGTLPMPDREGYILKGWYLGLDEYAQRVDEHYYVSEDITLYARWEVEPFTTGGDVKWYYNEDGALCTGKLQPGQSCWAEAAVSGPYEVSFAWKASGDYSSYFNVYTNGVIWFRSNYNNDYKWNYKYLDVPEGETITFRWEQIRTEYSDSTFYKYMAQLKYLDIGERHTITFDPNYTGAIPTQKLLSGALGTLPVPTRSGHKFEGWFTDPENGEQVTSTTPVRYDTTYYAHWSIAKFTVILNKNDGSGTKEQRVIERDKDFMLPTAGGNAAKKTGLGWSPRRGFTFMGWALSEKSKTAKFKNKDNVKNAAGTDETLNLYAIWTLDKTASYAIQYIRNDGSGMVRTVGFEYGKPQKLNSVTALGFARRGYTFVGWATSTENARNKKVWKADTGMVSTAAEPGKLLKIYAIWTLTPGYYSIRFNKNDGSGAWRELGYEYGKNTTLPTIEAGLGWGCPGYTFVGWRTKSEIDKGGTKIWLKDKGVTKTPVAAGKTLSIYAIWEKNSTGVEAPSVCTGEECFAGSAAETPVPVVQTVQAVAYFAEGDFQPVEARVESDGFTVVELGGSAYCGYVGNGVGELLGPDGSILLVVIAVE